MRSISNAKETLTARYWPPRKRFDKDGAATGRNASNAVKPRLPRPQSDADAHRSHDVVGIFVLAVVVPKSRERVRIESPVIACRDVLGRIVTLDRRHWERHVLSKRSIMSRVEHLLTSTLRSPLIVTESSVRSNRACFYSRELEFFPRYLLKIVVEYDRDDDGSVITAFLVESVDPGEAIIWTAPDFQPLP